jgi:hypothetical protein
MTVRWITSAGNLGTYPERIILDIPLTALSDVGPVTFSLHAGRLPRGLRVSTGSIKGSPTEVRKFTTSRFVIRASDGEDIQDRTFSVTVDGDDVPEWITREGFLNVGPNDAYYVLDNAYVNFQLQVRDPDIIAGDILEYYLVPAGGELPPGLSLSRSGVISGFTDPIFALEYVDSPTGAYDTGTFDTMPLDYANQTTTGFDSYIYDLETFDFTEPSKAPRRLSRFYTFIVAVSDGIHEVRRLFRIWVVTEEFLKSDNTILQVDTNLFQADASGERKPIWITESDLGRFRANNYVTIFLDVYDPPTLEGTITYFLLAINPDGSASTLPPGMTLDTTTGEIAGRVPYQAAVTRSYTFTMQAVNFPPILFSENYIIVGDWNISTDYIQGQAVRYQGFLWLCRENNRARRPVVGEQYWERGVATAEKTFTVEVIGEIESAIGWISDSDLGSIIPNIASTVVVEAESFLYGARTIYELVGGNLPPGLELISSGLIQGKVKQFSDSNGPGLTRLYDKVDSAIVDSSLSRDFGVSFDGESTTFDKKFTFQIKARDAIQAAANIKSFSLTVDTSRPKTFANLYTKAFQSKDKRLLWYNFITDSNIFRENEIYRFGDPNFGIQNEIKMLVYAGIESRDAQYFVQAMAKNHYRKQIRFGDVKYAVAKDQTTQEILYEVVYINIVDEFEKNGESISPVMQLPDYINSQVLVSYANIRVDSDIPFVSDRDHQRLFPNSIKNMRRRIRDIGERYREFLPLWMRSIQPNTFVEPGYTKAVILAYVKSGSSPSVISRIRSSGFDFKNLDFTADRYLIDALNGELENKYLAFPQRDVLNKLANPSQDTITVTPTVFGSFDSDTATFDSEALTFDQG